MDANQTNCPKCGQNVASGTMFCANCGTPITSTPPQSTNMAAGQKPTAPPKPSAPVAPSHAPAPPVAPSPIGSTPAAAAPASQPTPAYGTGTPSGGQPAGQGTPPQPTPYGQQPPHGQAAPQPTPYGQQAPYGQAAPQPTPYGQPAPGQFPAYGQPAGYGQYPAASKKKSSAAPIIIILAIVAFIAVALVVIFLLRSSGAPSAANQVDPVGYESEACPIEVLGEAEVFMHNGTQVYSFDSRNNSNSAIVYSEFWAFAYNSSGRLLTVTTTGLDAQWCTNDHYYKPGETIRADDFGYYEFRTASTAAYVYIVFNYIEFEDGSEWGTYTDNVHDMAPKTQDYFDWACDSLATPAAENHLSALFVTASAHVRRKVK